jgi:hypothetical protein
LLLQGCTSDITAPDEVKPTWSVGRLSNPDCSNGSGWWTQVRTPSTMNAPGSTTTPPEGYPLRPVIVYANPSGPRWGNIGSTISFGRDMNMQPCEYGADYSWQYAPDSLRPVYIDVPRESPFGTQDTLWNRLSPRERGTLYRVAKELAILPGIEAILPGIAGIALEGRALWIWDRLGRAYLRAQDQVPGMRTDSDNFVWSRMGRQPTSREDLRIKAYIRGCAAATQLRLTGYQNGDRSKLLASELGADWAADVVGTDVSQWQFSNRLSFLSSRGADAGNDGNSCAQSATDYFNTNTGELFDSSSGGGGTQF